MSTKPGGLGRGLASLIPDTKKDSTIKQQARQVWSGPAGSDDVTASAAPVVSSGVAHIEVSKIKANPYQPRTQFDHNKLEDLIASIKEHGILQPIVVSPTDDGYELIAGERRLRAATFLEFTQVPALIRDVTKQQQLELSLIENIQRQELNPIEEALSYKRLHDEFNIKQEDIGNRVGKSRSKIANMLRLLTLPDDIQNWLRDGKLTTGHAKVLLELESPQKQLVLAKKIMRQNMSVRDTSVNVKEMKGVAVKTHIRKAQDPKIKHQEKVLQSLLGTKVLIADKLGKGKVTIEYYAPEELDALIERLSHPDDLG